MYHDNGRRETDGTVGLVVVALAFYCQLCKWPQWIAFAKTGGSLQISRVLEPLQINSPARPSPTAVRLPSALASETYHNICTWAARSRRQTGSCRLLLLLLLLLLWAPAAEFAQYRDASQSLSEVSYLLLTATTPIRNQLHLGPVSAIWALGIIRTR